MGNSDSKRRPKSLSLAQNQKDYLEKYKDDLNEREALKLVADLQARGVVAAKSYIKQLHGKWKNVPLNIAVIGLSGSGKSSFINAIRCLDWDNAEHREHWAKTGVDETTLKIQEYLHPRNANIKIWDVPGYQGVKVDDEGPAYLDRIQAHNYDFFILVTRNRFYKSDVWLAKEIRKLEKNYVLVRTNIDNDLKNMPQDGWPIEASDENKRSHIRETLQKALKIQSAEYRVEIDTKVFLINSYDRANHDFPELEKEIVNRFPKEKKEALIMMLPSLSKEVIRAKKKTLRIDVWTAATLSAAAAVIPLPGVGTAIDIALLTTLYADLKGHLGLDLESLERTAKVYGVPKKSVLDFVAQHVPSRFSMELLVAAGRFALPFVISQTVEESLKSIPLINLIATAIAVPMSFGTTAWAAFAILEKLAGTAELVLAKCLEDSCNSLRELWTAPFSVALIGRPGSGKATFTNTIRHLNLQNEGHDRLWAAVGAKEIITHRKLHEHPENKLFEIWSLPHINGTSLTRENYAISEKVYLRSYDLYITLNESHFSEEELWLAKEIQKLGKPVIFVFTHVDIALHKMHMDDPHRWPQDTPESVMVTHIRNEHEKRLKEFETELFLINAQESEKFDFEALEHSIWTRCPTENLPEGELTSDTDIDVHAVTEKGGL